MKKVVTAAALIVALTFAGFQIASAHGGGYFSGNNYGPAYCNNYFNGNSGVTKTRANFGREAESARTGNRFAYGMGPGMMRGYGYGPGGMRQGYGPGYGRHMMDW